MFIIQGYYNFLGKQFSYKEFITISGLYSKLLFRFKPMSTIGWQ